MHFIFRCEDIRLLKTGKVVKHSSRVGAKKYLRTKVYLSDVSFSGRRYELYDLGIIHIEEHHRIIKGKGLMVFIPDNPRLKKWIGLGSLR